MLTLREFVDFLILLRPVGTVRDGTGNVISDSDLQTVYFELTHVDARWRSEWLDARFTEDTTPGVPHIHYRHRIVNGELLAKTTEPLETCLATNCKTSLEGINRQGMPTQKGDDFHYWNSPGREVARFVAFSGGLVLPVALTRRLIIS